VRSAHDLARRFGGGLPDDTMADTGVTARAGAGAR
jgi:hypothetical protein